MAGLNERLGIMPTPEGAISLVSFGDGLAGAYESTMQLGGGQFRAGYLAPCSLGFEWRFRANKIRGF
jgi:hypothetical protein